jgi:hypothetical protein
MKFFIKFLLYVVVNCVSFYFAYSQINIILLRNEYHMIFIEELLLFFTSKLTKT